MYLKTDRIIASIKGVVFRSYNTGMGSDYILDPTALVGWDDGTTVRRNNTVRPVSSGDFQEPYTFAARSIALSGTAIGSSRRELQNLRDKLTGLLAEGEYAELSIQTSSDLRYANVGLEGKIEWIQQHDTVAIFRIEFFAPDPYIYGAERTLTLNATTSEAGGGQAYPLEYALNYNAVNVGNVNRAVTNRGNIAAWPKFKVTGDYFSGFTIDNGFDKRVVYKGSVSYNSPVTIDMAKGTATQNGVDKSSLVSDRDWFSVKPNETLYPRFTPIQNASGWCDIIIRDTYI